MTREEREFQKYGMSEFVRRRRERQARAAAKDVEARMATLDEADPAVRERVRRAMWEGLYPDLEMPKE